ncbi:MAG TPA: winged helix-turn-helix domain-containing protein [Nitrososphaera sp.]|jgi:predicted transcriptional regulator|nr:winged helix-turn-helix domain-containing protein [Nitrososphaera sp.]
MKAAGTVDWQLIVKTDVVAKILEAAQRDNEIGQDTISTDAYLSRPQTNEYLSLMTRNDLLKYDAGSKIYKSTRKGDAFLRTYQEMGHFISLIDEEIGL